MKVEIKDLQKALDKAKKDGAIMIEVREGNMLSEKLNKVELTYETELGKTIIKIAQAESGAFNDITFTARF